MWRYKVELGLGNVAELEELGVGVGGLLANFHVVGFVKDPFRHKKDHHAGEWF
jgi:hypothetical protein